MNLPSVNLPSASLPSVTDTVLWLLGAPPVQVDPTAPVLRADDLGIARGEAVFETLRVAGGQARFVAAHLERMVRSATRVGFALPSGWEALITAAVASFPLAEGVLRLTCTKDGAAWALLTPVPASTLAQRADGVSAVTLTLGVPAGLRSEAPWLLGGVKSTSYAVNMATLRAAAERGADEAIWLSTDGFVLEGPTSTVVWVTGGQLVTPDPADVGTLPGTTLAVVAAVVQLEVRRGTATELAAASEVALLSSVRGVAPVVRLDGRLLPLGPVIRRLGAAFEAALLHG